MDDDWKADPLGWSRRRQDAAATKKPSGDTRTDRSDEPQYQSADDAEAAAAIDDDEMCLTCIGIAP